jgi:hypothetical protein
MPGGEDIESRSAEGTSQPEQPAASAGRLVDAPSRDPEDWLPPPQQKHFSFFECVHQIDRDTLRVLAARDYTLGYAAMLWTNVHRAMAARATAEILPEFRERLRDLNGALGSARAASLWQHVSDAVNREAARTSPDDLSKLRALLARTHISSEWINDTLVADPGAKASPPERLGDAIEVPPWLVQRLYEQEREEVKNPQVLLSQPPESLLNYAIRTDDGRYWAGWTCLDWKVFIETDASHPSWPCVCINAAASTFGDYPTVTELPPEKPPALHYPPGSFPFNPQPAVHGPDTLNLAYNWDKRVKNYLPSTEQIYFFPSGGPTLYPYHLLLTTSGLLNIDWKALKERLDKEAGQFDDKVIQRLIDLLKGQQLFGFSLDPLLKATSAAKDALTSLVQTVLNWLTAQLSGAKFPPLSITHKVQWVTPKGAKMTAAGTIETEPESSVYLWMLDKNGALQAMLPPKGAPVPPPDPDKVAPPAVVWTGESKLPDKLPAKTFYTLVNEAESERKKDTEQSPIYWLLPGDPKSLHAFIKLLEDQKEAAGEYWVAVRTEVRKVRTGLKKP